MRHYWDEWWDRRPQEWKAKLFISLVLGFVFLAGGLIYIVHRWTEKEQVLSDAREYHRKRIEASDKLIAPTSKPLSVPAFRNTQDMGARPAE